MNLSGFHFLQSIFKIIFLRLSVVFFATIMVPSLAMAQSSNLSSDSELFSEDTGTWNSSIIYHGDNDQLIYHSDVEGNRIPDFSFAGYHGGGVDLPELPVYIVLDPSSSGDDTQQIQEALDQAGSLAKNDQGHRGAVLLNPGTYHISQRIIIRHSGVVLRGSGDGDNPVNDTIIHAVKNIGNVSIQIGTGNVDWSIAQGSALTEIESEIVPVGARTFEVANANGFNIGDDIIIWHRASEEWVEAVDYGGRPLSAPNPWQAGENNLHIQMKREITGISGNIIAVDVPVYNHLERHLSQALVFKPDFSQLIKESGVEDFRLVLESDDPFSDEHGNHAIFFNGVEDSWADAITVMHFRNTGIGTTNSSFVTIQNSKALEPHSPITGARRYNFNVSTRSNNILFTNNLATEGRHCFVSNGTASVSGVVFHDSRSFGAHNTSEGHRRWSQGLLFDKLVFRETNDNRILGLYNRGDWGTRHGWSSAHSVVWNSDPDQGNRIFIQKPPTAQNYGIANRGTVTGDGPWEGNVGHIEGTGEMPAIASLYEAQLHDRLVHGIPPDAPGNVTLTQLSDEKQSLRLDWVYNSLSEVDLIIERSVNGDAFETLVELKSGISSYTDNVEGEEDYRYRIAARDEGRMSAWSNVVGLNLGMSSFILRSPASGTVISLMKDMIGNLNLWWDETESDFDVSYTWYLDHTAGDFTDPLMERSTEIQLVEVPYSDIYDTLVNEGIEAGSTFEGIWTVKASGGGVEKWADGPFTIELELGEVSTSNSNEESLIPSELHLHQNYPNPFNPTTQIRYDIPNHTHVRVEIYNMLGRKIARLVDEQKNAGHYVTSFDASGLSSGIYIYRLQAGSFTVTRQMVMIK